ETTSNCRTTCSAADCAGRSSCPDLARRDRSHSWRDWGARGQNGKVVAGSVSERPKVQHSKCCVVSKPPWVRIPPLPRCEARNHAETPSWFRAFPGRSGGGVDRPLH